MSLKPLVRRFRGLRVGVVGDLMADHHILGVPTRLSREAPVVILRHEREFYVPGGAANCAANLLSLGAEVHVFGAVGRDAAGARLRTLLRGARLSGVVSGAGYPTVTKTRVLAGGAHRTKQQIVRIDREPPPLPAALAGRIEAAVARAPRMDAWILSDYGYGAVTKGLLARMARLSARTLVVGSSRYAVGGMKGLSAVTANEAEAQAASGHEAPREAGRRLARLLKPRRALILTLGNEGMVCYAGSRETALPASGSQEAVDVTGAGDTVCAVLTLALAAGAEPLDAARLANAAAGEAVMRPGAATLTPRELERVAP